MTHIFEATIVKFDSLNQGQIRFDILKCGRPLELGDRIVYQQLSTSEGELTGEEVEFIVDYIFVDTGELRKDYQAFSFKEKEPND